MRIPSIELMQKIRDKLPEQLGSRYNVTTYQYGSAFMTGLDYETHPDIVVVNKRTKKVTMVEVKGSTPDDDLPFAALPIMLKMKKANRRLDPKVVLVSVSKVPEQLERRLEKGGVNVIEWSEEEDVISEIANIIKKPRRRRSR